MAHITPAAKGRAAATTRAPQHGRAARTDLFVVSGVAALAALAYAVLPGGSVARVALALAVLFFVPGYLLIEAVAQPAVTPAQRFVRGGVAVGVSPAVIGLLALATVVLPGGFGPGAIVAVVTAACFALAGVALWRRRRALLAAAVADPASA